MSSITPLGKRVIVKPESAEEVTSFGLVLSDAAEEKPMQGEIVSISEEVKTVKVGEKVLFRKYSPTEFKNDQGEDLYVLEEEDLLAKIG